jgi:hypothetical protein
MTTREEEWDMLQNIWENAFEALEWEKAFALDESLPQEVVRILHPMPEIKDAVLECWRDKMRDAVNELYQRCKDGD